MTGPKDQSQNKRPLAKMTMLTKQSKVHNETIWKSPYLWKFLPKDQSQNKRPLAKMMMLTKQSKVHNETIWKSPYLWKFLSHDLANWSIYMETGELCCLKWSYSLTLCEIPWRLSSILPNVKISLTLCKIPWQFPDLEKFYFSLTFPWRLWTLHIHYKVWDEIT